MKIRANKKPNINSLNRTLNGLHKRGWHTYGDNIKERGFYYRLRKAKRK